MTYAAYHSYHDIQNIMAFIVPTSNANPIISRAYNSNKYDYVTDSKVVLHSISASRHQADTNEIQGIGRIHGMVDVVRFAQNRFTTIAPRIEDLVRLSEEDGDCPTSIESLKCMLKFFEAIRPGFYNPQITLNENGSFQASWKKGDTNLVTARFRDKEEIDYVIFQPSKYRSRPIIYNGNMKLLDFWNFLIRLNLTGLIRT